MESDASAIYRFGRFVLHLERGALLADGEERVLRAKSFALLRHFVENAGRLIGRDEIMRTVWPDVFVTDDSIAQCIRDIRRALGDDQQQFLRTLPRRGYLFIAQAPRSTEQPAVAAPIAPAAIAEAVDPIPRSPRLPDNPSIAVLPFRNMSGDPEQGYFADGVVEEIITALCRIRLLFVIARNSSFSYKGRSVDVTQVGRELGVRYVLEGSVRRAANRVRIIGHLIDAATGAHLWADRFEGELEDIFDLQDRVTDRVVAAIVPTLERAEVERAQRKPTESLGAYDYYLRGIAALYQFTSREANVEAFRLFKHAIELDPNFAAAYGMAAHCHVLRIANDWIVTPADEISEAERLAQRAIRLGRDDPLALTAAGAVLAYATRDLDAANASIGQALALNANLAFAWFWGGYVKLWLGDPDAAVEHFERAMRLSPLDPYMPRLQAATADAHFHAGRYDEASSWAAMATGDAWYHNGLRILAASNALAGRLEQARMAIARLRQLDPELRVSNLRYVQGPYRRPEDISRYEEAMRIAGLPQ